MPRKKTKPLEGIVSYFMDAPYAEADAAFTVLTIVMAGRQQREAPAPVAAPTRRSHKRKTTTTPADSAMPGPVAKVGD